MHAVAGETRWQQAARRLAARLLFARFAEALQTPLASAGALSAIALLLARMAIFPLAAAVWSSGLSVTVALGFAVRVALRGRAEARREALARLDSALGLRDRLAAAAEGAVAWPEFPAVVPDVVRWRWPQVLGAPAFLAAIVTLALVLPVKAPAPPVVPPAERPPVFGELTQLVEELRQSDAAAPSALDELQNTLDELAARDNAGLYSHGALEAAANLVDQTAAGAGELAAGLEAAEGALTQLADSSDPASTKAAQDALNSALRDLERSRLPVNPALAGGLQHAAAGNLDPQKLANLSRNLRNASRRAGQNTGSTTVNFRQRTGSPSRGKGPGGTDGDGPGSGGIARGPGHPPLELASEAAERRDGKASALESADSDQAALGDLVAESSGAPRTDLRTAPSGGSGGAFAEPGRGGESARVDELTPAERRAVKRFFK